MQITIFKELTTEEHLLELEAIAAKYEGLYVDMENKDERKFVKDKAYDIQQLLKNLDRKRIDESKNYKTKVELEAASIKQRLEDANAPFMILIDEHKAARAKVIAEQKAIDDAKALLIQIEDDHEIALMQNKIFDIDKAEAAQAQIKRDEALKAEAIKGAELEKLRIIEQAKIDQDNAVKAESKRLADIEQVKIYEEAKRKSDIEHVTAICSAAKQSLMQYANLTEEQAVSSVKAIRNNLISNVTINF